MNPHTTYLVVSDSNSPWLGAGLSGSSSVRHHLRPWTAPMAELEDLARTADGIVLDVPKIRDGSGSDFLSDYLHRVFRMMTAAREGRCRGVVLRSRLELFARCPANWRVDEKWRTRPTAGIQDVAAYLLECSVRELLRETGISGNVLRVADTEQALMEANVAIPDLLCEPVGGGSFFWRIRHIGIRPSTPWDYRPWREVLAPANPIPSREIRNVVVFGAGGPMAAALVPLLRDRYTLRLTDIRPLAEIRAEGYPHQPPGSPLPETPDPPHSEMRCDVSDPAAVDAACEGMDAIVNCSVIRYTDQDFAVNMGGCWNIAAAAARHGIRRVVQTGPQLTGLDPIVGYHLEEDVPGNAPARPGANQYGHSKFLGNEILRVFAENHGLEVPVLVFNGFVTPQSRGRNAFETTFEEAADAIRLALEVPSLPSPWEFITVCNDLPHGRFSSQRATELLGWSSQELEDTWRDL